MLKIKVNNKVIELNNNVAGLFGSIQTMGSAHSSVARRDTLRIDFPFNRTQYDEIGWQDFMKWYLIEEIPTGEGQEPQEIEYDYSDYYLICDVVEKQDTGNITVYMGKPTKEELLQAEVDDLMDIL